MKLVMKKIQLERLVDALEYEIRRLKFVDKGHLGGKIRYLESLLWECQPALALIDLFDKDDGLPEISIDLGSDAKYVIEAMRHHRSCVWGENVFGTTVD